MRAAIKNSKKNRVKLPHVNNNPLPSNQIFVQTPFSHSTLKTHAAKPLAFSLHFLFRRDQNHYPKLTSKIMKCEQILKKHSRKNSGNNPEKKKQALFSDLKHLLLVYTFNILKQKRKTYMRKKYDKKHPRKNYIKLRLQKKIRLGKKNGHFATAQYQLKII